MPDLVPWGRRVLVGMTDRTDGSDTIDRAAAADYVASMAAVLAAMAREHGLEALAHLLDMARLEAEEAGRQGKVSE